MLKSTTLFFFASLFAVVLGLFLAPQFNAESDFSYKPRKGNIGLLEPSDHWMRIRSYEDGFDQEQFMDRIEEVKTHAAYTSDSRDTDLGLDWQEEGPGNIGGRIDVITGSEINPDIIYVGATNGGIFKTINGGSDWLPIFDDQPFLAIGAITLNPANEDELYVGTGDRNFTGNSFIGNGIYKSTNAGASWENIGLENTGAITEIIVHPIDEEIVYASALGNPHNKSTDRGVYRSLDGGETWANVLFIADSAGVVDLVMDPFNPDVLYATGYNRMRNYYNSVITGPNARVYKTEDGGDTWMMLAGGLPLEDNCRIGLAVSNEEPNTLHVLVVDGETIDVKDIYKSTDGGDSFVALNVHDDGDLPSFVMGGFGWYFGEVYMNPYNNDHLIIPGVDMFQSLDGGETWDMNVPAWWTYEVHADKHAILFLDENSYIIGTDGGLYKTENNGDHLDRYR
jgi:hypothetical protein